MTMPTGAMRASPPFGFVGRHEFRSADPESSFTSPLWTAITPTLDHPTVREAEGESKTTHTCSSHLIAYERWLNRSHRLCPLACKEECLEGFPDEVRHALDGKVREQAPPRFAQRSWMDTCARVPGPCLVTNWMFGSCSGPTNRARDIARRPIGSMERLLTGWLPIFLRWRYLVAIDELKSEASLENAARNWLRPSGTSCTPLLAWPDHLR